MNSINGKSKFVGLLIHLFIYTMQKDGGRIVKLNDFKKLPL